MLGVLGFIQDASCHHCLADGVALFGDLLCILAVVKNILNIWPNCGLWSAIQAVQVDLLHLLLVSLGHLEVVLLGQAESLVYWRRRQICIRELLIGKLGSLLLNRGEHFALIIALQDVVKLGAHLVSHLSKVTAPLLAILLVLRPTFDVLVKD